MAPACSPSRPTPDTRPPTPEGRWAENETLAVRYQHGDAAAGERLLELNEPLVQSIASRAIGRAHYGMEREDLLQEGRLGLLHAARKFDPSRGCCFSTSAATWVRHWIGRAIEEQSRLIRIPSRWQYGSARVPTEGECDGAPRGAWGAPLPAQPLSLDYHAEGGGGRLGDLIPAPEAFEAPAEAAVALEELMARAGLSGAERIVLYRHWG